MTRAPGAFFMEIEIIRHGTSCPTVNSEKGCLFLSPLAGLVRREPGGGGGGRRRGEGNRRRGEGGEEKETREGKDTIKARQKKKTGVSTDFFSHGGTVKKNKKQKKNPYV
jgi:hypothetical protein